MNKTHAVTGAFGYSGRYIATRLLEQGSKVITLTNSMNRESTLHNRVQAFPLSFDDPVRLAQSLEGVEVLYNTYWVRFNDRHFSHASAVENTRRLFAAAKHAGVGRIVHVSITNPHEGCGLEYFEGKARLERDLEESGMPYSILRPTVLFGREDILINNIAWALRRFPFFGIFGDGSYRLQPIYVEDLALLAVEEGKQSGNRLINAVGPETFTYKELVQSIAKSIDVHPRLLPLPPRVGYCCGKIIGWAMRDQFITWEEVKGLMGGFLCVDTPATGTTALTEWMDRNAESLGRHYASELARRRNRAVPYLRCMNA
jgi:NADH dehydrogenase